MDFGVRDWITGTYIMGIHHADTLIRVQRGTEREHVLE